MTWFCVVPHWMYWFIRSQWDTERVLTQPVCSIKQQFQSASSSALVPVYALRFQSTSFGVAVSVYLIQYSGSSLLYPVLQFQSTTHLVLQFQSTSSGAAIPVYLIQYSGSSLSHPLLWFQLSLPVQQFQSTSSSAAIPVCLIQCFCSSLLHSVLQFQSTSSSPEDFNFSLISCSLFLFLCTFCFFQISLFLNNCYVIFDVLFIIHYLSLYN